MSTTNEKKFDVVCGMELDPAEVACTSVYKNITYDFCSESCKEHFDNDPKKYIA